MKKPIEKRNTYSDYLSSMSIRLYPLKERIIGNTRLQEKPAREQSLCQKSGKFMNKLFSVNRIKELK